MSASQIVARNVRILRLARAWTQTEAGERLGAIGGPHWSKANWSALERTADGTRMRSFSADDLTWMSKLFGVPIGDLFEEMSTISCPQCCGTGRVTVVQATATAHPGQPELPLDGEA